MEDNNTSFAVQEIAHVLADLLYKKDTADHSFKAKIVEITGPKKCKVLYCGQTYTASSYVTYNVGDYVWVCAPCNNWNDLFVVCKS